MRGAQLRPRWSRLVVFIGAVLVMDATIRSSVGIDLPVVTMALVVSLSVFAPIANRVREFLNSSDRRADENPLLQALGSDPITEQPARRSVESVLARLVRTFDLTGAQVVERGGKVTAADGVVDWDDPLALRMTLSGGNPQLGHAVFGRKRSGLSFTPSDLEALEVAVEYLSSNLRLAHGHEEQTAALANLRAQHADVQSHGSALGAVLDGRDKAAAGLRVYALGGLRVERDGEPIRRWGGEKAGSRQAEALFAFLFDRGERGVSKDEILELIWPEVELDRADVAFHRTMLGLRSTLHSGRGGPASARPVTFHNDRYRLDPSIIAWSDVDAFQRLLGEARSPRGDTALRLLEEARSLYRGEYLDDCPIYGDSAAVEVRREDLRRAFVDLLVDLGQRYAGLGDWPSASACARQAERLSDEPHPALEQALTSLMVAPRAMSV